MGQRLLTGAGKIWRTEYGLQWLIQGLIRYLSLEMHIYLKVRY
jgi:hypothetical protein